MDESRSDNLGSAAELPEVPSESTSTPTVTEPVESGSVVEAAVPSSEPVTLGPQIYCHACGSQIDARAEICPRCGVRQRPATVGTKNKIVAALLAIFLGGFGIHKFYLGKTAQGVIYLIFFWTFIPAIVGFIEGIIYLTKSDEDFARAYG